MAHIMAALDIVCRALLVINCLVCCGITYPALFIMHCCAVLLVASLVHMLALRCKARLALSLYLAFKGSVVDSLALPVAHLAAPLLKESLEDGAVDGVVSCPTFWTSVSIITISLCNHLQQY